MEETLGECVLYELLNAVVVELRLLVRLFAAAWWRRRVEPDDLGVYAV